MKNTILTTGTCTSKIWLLNIPCEFELPGNEAIIRKEGNRLIIGPVQRSSLLPLLATLEPRDEDFPEIEDLSPEDVDL